LEHDANFTPWVMAAEDAGAHVRYVDINTADCTLDLDDFRQKINSRTRLVAVGCASNATGTVNPVEKICQWAHEAGALTFLDAVHFAPHSLVDVQACSAYKFFGPHVGILWGRRELLSELQPYKLRPASNDLPGRWMTGTQNHECLAGTMAAVEYLAELGRRVDRRSDLNRRDRLASAYQAIQHYESRLIQRLIEGLQRIQGVRIWGITATEQMTQRLPTVSFTHERMSPSEIAASLGQRGIFVWHGNYYAQPLTEALGLEPEGMVRVGLVHYNTEHEVDRLLNSLDEVLLG
jgi:cysteine desulfurase family protein (TIGR01976 family)